MEAWRLSELVESRVTSRQRIILQISCSVCILLETLNSTHGLQLKNLSSTCRYSFGHRWPFEFSTGLIHGWKISTAKAINTSWLNGAGVLLGSTISVASSLVVRFTFSQASLYQVRLVMQYVPRRGVSPTILMRAAMYLDTKTVVVKHSVLCPNSLWRPLHLLLKMILDFLLCHVQSVAMGHYRLKLPGLGQVWNM